MSSSVTYKEWATSVCVISFFFKSPSHSNPFLWSILVIGETLLIFKQSYMLLQTVWMNKGSWMVSLHWWMHGSHWLQCKKGWVWQQYVTTGSTIYTCLAAGSAFTSAAQHQTSHSPFCRSAQIPDWNLPLQYVHLSSSKAMPQTSTFFQVCAEKHWDEFWATKSFCRTKWTEKF